MSHRGQGGGLTDVEERVHQLNEVVSLFVDKVHADLDLDLAFDPSSIAYMDIILTEVNRTGHELAPSLYLSIGGYVGETLIRTFGGRWREGEEHLVVELEGEEHRYEAPVFDWVKRAHADPHGETLGQRVWDAVGGDHVPGDGAWEASDGPD